MVISGLISRADSSSTPHILSGRHSLLHFHEHWGLCSTEMCHCLVHHVDNSRRQWLTRPARSGRAPLIPPSLLGLHPSAISTSLSTRALLCLGYDGCNFFRGRHGSHVGPRNCSSSLGSSSPAPSSSSRCQRIFSRSLARFRGHRPEPLSRSSSSRDGASLSRLRGLSAGAIGPPDGTSLSLARDGASSSSSPSSRATAPLPPLSQLRGLGARASLARRRLLFFFTRRRIYPCRSKNSRPADRLLWRSLSLSLFAPPRPSARGSPVRDGASSSSSSRDGVSLSGCEASG